MALPTLVRHNVDPFEVAQRDFDSFLGRLVGNRFMDQANTFAPYAVDVREDGDHLIVDAELPGFKKDEIDVNIENQTLTISAEHKAEKSEGNGKEKGDWLLRERRYTRFQRSFTLPQTVDSQSVNAKLDNGILTITLNKREETKPRRITVS